MKFNSASNVERPIRLNAKTRQWAWESMHGKYGTEAMQTPFLNIDDENFLHYEHIEKYDIMIRKIASEAPLRICEEEMVSGAATLGAAIWHVVPVYHQGKVIFSGVSHLTIDYETTLRCGLRFYEEKIAERLNDESLSEKQVRFLQSLLNTIDALRVYHSRYLQATKEAKPEIYKNLLQVPFQPVRNFHEAVQSIWFIFSFVRLCGNWPGIGRIDWLLGDYLKRDLETGVLTKKQAREILASFFIKGTEWIQENTPPNSGDAQHYQNIVLAGVDENGVEVTNEVTYLVLDIVEELGISDFPITVRISKKTSEKLLNKVARVIRHGGGVVAVYNEDLILKSLTDFGYPLNEARSFANDGCWEVQIPGKTFFQYCPFDSLALLQQQTLNNYEKVNYTSFQSLYEAYVSRLEETVKRIFDDARNKYLTYSVPGGDWNWQPSIPTSVVSLFEQGCIEKAKSYFEGGPIYSVISPHIGGIADTVNSLYAIKKLVFEENKLSFAEFMAVLRNNWQGYEDLRAYVSAYPYYGTDNDEVDEIYTKLLHDFYLICKKYDTNPLVHFPAGVSTFGREINWLPNRLATPEGSVKGDILAGNASPTPGTDTEGITAVIKSYTKANLSEMVTGTALDLKIAPTSIQGENGIVALKELIRGFVKLGGYFMQIDSVSAETLKKAQENPKEYKTLSVRVSGWNARFITLTKEWQNMIIQRTEHNG